MLKIVSYLLLLTSLFCKAQDKKDKHGDIILFNKGIALWEFYNETLYPEETKSQYDTIIDEQKKLNEKAIDLKEVILDKSLGYFTEMIDEYPKSNLIFRALNNKAQLEFILDYMEDAKKTYLEIYQSKANDKEKGGIGSGLMAEPYANYKNRALKQLAEIEYKNKNYFQAITYLDLTKKFPYQHFCGNEFAYEEIYMAESYAKNYIGLKDVKKALAYLMPNIIYNGLANNDNIVKQTVKTLIEYFGKEKSCIYFNDAKKNLYVKKVIIDKQTYNQYYINFLGDEIKIATPWDVFDPNDEEEMNLMKLSMENSLFNKLLNER